MLRVGVALVVGRRLVQPPHLRLILRHALALSAANAEIVMRVGMALLSRLPVQYSRAACALSCGMPLASRSA
jgi:hypothetical protein